MDNMEFFFRNYLYRLFGMFNFRCLGCGDMGVIYVCCG